MKTDIWTKEDTEKVAEKIIEEIKNKGGIEQIDNLFRIAGKINIHMKRVFYFPPAFKEILSRELLLGLKIKQGRLFFVLIPVYGEEDREEIKEVLHELKQKYLDEEKKIEEIIQSFEEAIKQQNG